MSAQVGARVQIQARREPSGEVRESWLEARPSGLFVDELPVSPRMLEAAFARYAKPLAAAAPPRAEDDERIDLVLDDGRGVVLRAFTFRGWGDVLPSDYLLWEADGSEPVAAPVTLVGAALIALARAAAGSGSG